MTMPVVSDELRAALDKTQRYPSVRVVAGEAQVDISAYVESVKVSPATAERAGTATLVLVPGTLFDPLNLNAPYSELLGEDAVVRIFKSEQGEEHPWFYGLVTKGETLERRGQDDKLTLTLLDRSKNFSRIKVTTKLYQQVQANQIIRELFMAHGLAENEIGLTTLDYEIWEVQFVDETLMDIARMCLAAKRYAVFFDAEGKLVSVPPANAEITPDVYDWTEDSKAEFEQGTLTGNAVVTEDGKLELDPPSSYTDFSEYPTNQQPGDWTKSGTSGAASLTVSEDTSPPNKYLNMYVPSYHSNVAFSWNTPGELWDVEILTCLYLTTNAPSCGGPLLRLTADNRFARATLDYRGSAGRAFLFIHGGSDYTFEGPARGWYANTWYYVRFQAVANRYRVRFWPRGQAEPDIWDIDVENAALTAPGWVGVGDSTLSNSQRTWFDCFEVRGAVGRRISPEFNISPVSRAQGSSISWSATVPTGCTLKVETRLSFNGGLNWTDWTEAVSGNAIPGISKGADLSNARLQTRITITSSVSGTTPSVSGISAQILSYPSVSGIVTWQYDGRHVQVLSSQWGDARTPNTVVVYGRTTELFEPPLEEQAIGTWSGRTGLWNGWAEVTAWYSADHKMKAKDPRLSGTDLGEGWHACGNVTQARIVSVADTYCIVQIYNREATWNAGDYSFTIYAKPFGTAVPGVIMATARDNAEIVRDGGEILEEIDEIPIFTQEDAQALADATLQLYTWLRYTITVRVLGNMTHHVGEVIQVYNPRTDCTVTLYVYEIEHEFKRGSHDLTTLGCAVMNVEEGLPL